MDHSHSLSNKTQHDVATDPATGKFIVADILPPRRSGVDVRSAMAVRRIPSKRTIQTPSKQSVPVKKKQSEQKIDEWFRKDQSVRKDKTTADNISPRSPMKWRMYAGLFIAGVLIAGAYFASYYYAEMHVLVTLRSQSVEFAETIRVMKEPETENDIPGELLELSKTSSKTFRAMGSDDVRANASGVISIYNAFNSKPQVLVANTRFESPDGQIYRIREPVTVPAAVITDGSIMPKSIDVKVWADQPGQEFNKDLTDFTIPGFKGSPRFNGFYARSKTPLTGGFIGTATIISHQDRDSAEESIERDVKTEINLELERSTPQGFTLLDGASEIAIVDKFCSADVGDVAIEFTCSITLEARSLVFRKDDLRDFLIEKADLVHADVLISNWDEISIDVKRRSIENGFQTIAVKGLTTFVWNLDSSVLASDIIANQDPNTLTEVFKRYDAIDRVDVQFSPQWMRSIPNNTSRITVETSY